MKVTTVSHNRECFVDDRVTLWRDYSDRLIGGHDLSIAVHRDDQIIDNEIAIVIDILGLDFHHAQGIANGRPVNSHAH